MTFINRISKNADGSAVGGRRVEEEDGHVQVAAGAGSTRDVGQVGVGDSLVGGDGSRPIGLLHAVGERVGSRPAVYSVGARRAGLIDERNERSREIVARERVEAGDEGKQARSAESTVKPRIGRNHARRRPRARRDQAGSPAVHGRNTGKRWLCGG